jgi:hypothetical protein
MGKGGKEVIVIPLIVTFKGTRSAIICESFLTSIGWYYSNLTRLLYAKFVTYYLSVFQAGEIRCINEYISVYTNTI